MMGAEISSENAEIPLPQMSTATMQTCTVSVLRFLRIRVILASLSNFFHFSGKTLKVAHTRDIMNTISGRMIHLRLVPLISFRNTSTRRRCRQPLAQRSPSCFRLTLLKLCLTRLVMWFPLLVSIFNHYWILSRTLDQAWNNSKALLTRGYGPSFGWVMQCALTTARTYIGYLRPATLTSSAYTLIDNKHNLSPPQLQLARW